MKKEIAEKWVKALRSGKYKQAQMVLQDSSGAFCCLGVLCDLAEKENIVEVKNDSLGILYTSLDNNFDFSYSVLTYAVKRWAGMNSDTGIYHPNQNSNSLTNLNDSGYTFEQIADRIERFWKQL